MLIELKEEKRKKNILDILIKYRFIIAIIAFVFLVAFKIHGSSIGVWDQYVAEKINTDEKTVLWGKDRAIIAIINLYFINISKIFFFLFSSFNSISMLSPL